MRYVTYDDEGNLTGFFDQELTEEHALNYIDVGDMPSAGWPMYRANAARDGVELAPAQPPQQATVPAEVSMLGLRLALLDGSLWGATEALVLTWSDRLQIDWGARPAQRRDGAVAAALAAGLELTALQVDALWIAAASSVGGV